MDIILKLIAKALEFFARKGVSNREYEYVLQRLKAEQRQVAVLQAALDDANSEIDRLRSNMGPGERFDSVFDPKADGYTL